jgi:hypothetical protein
MVRIKPKEITKKGSVPTNGSIFFTIFQTFMSGTDKKATLLLILVHILPTILILLLSTNVTEAERMTKEIGELF